MAGNDTGAVDGRAERIAEARRLRTDEGLSKHQIAERFGVSTGTLTTWLAGLDPPQWTKRPNAKDDLRTRARALRREHRSVPEIAAEVGVAKSTAYQWVRDIPLDADARRALFAREHSSTADHARMMAEARWTEYRAERDRLRAETITSAAGSVGVLARDELLRMGALIYWCEGTKAKPWNPSRRIVFVNSDPGLIAVFLAFLAAVGVERDRIHFRVAIHETADADAAVDWWAAAVDADPATFHPTTFKRHKPKTVRRNTGAEYRGCLVVTVSRGREVYDMIEGWVSGVVGAAARFVAAEHPGRE
ncbi:MAG TPA: resolvase [Actinocatenispora sp.]